MDLVNIKGIKDFRTDTQGKVLLGIADVMEGDEFGDDIFHDDPILNELAKYLRAELDKLPLISVPVASIGGNLLRLYPQQPLLCHIPEYLDFLLQKGVKVKAINTEHSFICLSIYKEITKDDCDQLITVTKKFVQLIYDQILWLGNYSLAKHFLAMQYGYGSMKFNCTYWYKGIDLLGIREKYGQEFINKLVFHCLCFEINKVCSLKPKYLQLGPLSKYWNEKLETLWKKIFQGVWGQWKYENNLEDYQGPEIIYNKETRADIAPIELITGNVKNLCFVGGGKDSLASISIMNSIGEPYDVLTYTNSVYGTAKSQIKVIDPFLSRAVGKDYNLQYIYDDFNDCPILQLHQEFDIQGLIAGETPSSVFGCLFWVLGKGYQNIILGHQKSADTGNLIWKGKSINHQWGKSTEAEILLSDYIKQELITNLHYFSILKNLYDTGIIMVAVAQQNLLPYTHSCNIDKPWCKRCPKCCYVWALYMAFSDIPLVEKIFQGTNLLDIEENQIWWRQLLGLEDHTPFECVGKVEEARLCFRIMEKKGVNGAAMNIFKEEVPQLDYLLILDEFSSIDFSYKRIPEQIEQKVITFVQTVIKKKKKEISLFLEA